MPPARRALLPLAIAALASGCAVPTEAGFPDVAKVTRERTGHEVRWRRDAPAARAIEHAVKRLLASELTAERAAQIALLNNRSLQATYEALGVAQADVAQAGMLQNPSIEGAIELPVDGGAPELSFGVSQDFLSILFLSARRRLAEAELDAVRLEVTHAVLALAADTREAFFTLQGATQLAAMQHVIADASQASLDLALRQHEAETLSDLDLVTQQVATEAVRLDLARSELEVRAAHERLTRLLGLWGPDIAFRIVPRLPNLPAREPSLDHVEQLAIARRLDVAAARRRTEVLERAIAIARDGRFLGALDLGVEGTRDPGEPLRVGPSAHLVLPIFDQGQAAIARIEAERRRAEHDLVALAINARSEVREARDRLLAARAAAERYKAVVVPIHERLVALSQQQYDAMLIGVYQVLAAKQMETSAYREYIEAVRDYWIAKVALERAAGGPIDNRSDDDEKK